jgi:hypothetical protein
MNFLVFHFHAARRKKFKKVIARGRCRFEIHATVIFKILKFLAWCNYSISRQQAMKEGDARDLSPWNINGFNKNLTVSFSFTPHRNP